MPKSRVVWPGGGEIAAGVPALRRGMTCKEAGPAGTLGLDAGTEHHRGPRYRVYLDRDLQPYHLINPSWSGPVPIVDMRCVSLARSTPQIETTCRLSSKHRPERRPGMGC